MVLVPCNASPIGRRGERLRDKLAAMRPLLALAVIAACGSPHTSGPSVPEPAGAFPAARWVPASPTYVIAAHTVRDGQRAVRELIDSFGVLGEYDSKVAGQGLAFMLAVNPLDPDPVAGIGFDLEGGIALFSEDVNPTFVAHLSAPEQLQAFFDQQRKKGLVTTSVMIEGTEVFTAKLVGGMRASWAVDKDWFWLHFNFMDGKGDDTWFAHSHRPAGNAWAAHWTWAEHVGQGVATHSPSVVGFLDLRGVLGTLAERFPRALACAKIVQPIGGIALAVDGDLKHANARLAIDLGSSSKTVAASILPPPPGWAEVATNAPIAVQMNLDVLALSGWLGPCGELFGFDFGGVQATGIRSLRGVLKTFDPDDKNASTGAVSFDVTSAAFFAKYNEQLDFPGRSLFDKSRKFGPYAGHRMSPPMFPTLEYVLSDRVVLVGVGEGLLDKIVAGNPAAAPPPALSIDVYPSGLSANAWEVLLDIAGIGHPKLVARHLLGWRDGHVRLALEGDSLVLEANGNHR
jgi:hypothetical protein